MASRGKKTTMAKLSRENRKHEKRAEKARRAEQRKREGVLANSQEQEPDAEEAWQLTRGLAELDG
jgi:hypothetical protein